MKQIINTITAVGKYWRIILIMLTMAFVISAAMTGTFAWTDTAQHRTNTAAGGGTPKLSNAILQKYEKDIYGTETVIPVPGAEFALYKINDDGTQILADKYVTDFKGQISAADLNAGSYFWQETLPPKGFLPETEKGKPKKYHFSVTTQGGGAVFTTAYNIREQETKPEAPVPTPNVPSGIPVPNEPGGKSPKTGESGIVMLRLVIMLISLSGLIIIIILWKQKQNKKQYIPKY